MSWNPADMMIAPPKDMDKDLIKVINPEVAVPKWHAENCDNIYNGIMRALHQMYIEQAQSGKAKEKDMEGQYLFLQKMSDGLFDLIEKILVDILSLRNTSMAGGSVKISPANYTIVKPTQFAIKTEDDLLQEYSEATKAFVPDFVKSRQLSELVDKLYGGDNVMQRKTSLICQMDCLATTSENDKLAKVNGGAISPRTWQFNTVLPSILDGIIRDKGGEWFITAPYEDIKALVDAAFELIPAAPPPAQTKAIPADRIPALGA